MNTVELKSYILSNNKVPQVLEYIGCSNIKEHRKNYSFATKYNTKAFSTVVKKNSSLTVKVYADNDVGQIGGDIINLTSKLMNVSLGEAIKIIHQAVGLDYDGYEEISEEELEKLRETKEKPNKIIKLDFYTEKEILKFYKPMPYIDYIKEGITSSTQEVFMIGFSKAYNRVVIPHRYYKNRKDTFVGLVGRTVLKNHKVMGIPKYFPLIVYLKSQNLYGLYENRKYIKQAGYINIFEAEKSVMKRYSRLDRTGVALCCHEISDKQVEIILGLNVDVIVQLDSDMPLNEVMKVCDRFYNKRKVYYIVDEFSLLGEKESTADKHNKIYNFLWNRKKLYGPEEHDTYKNYEARMKLERNWY